MADLSKVRDGHGRKKFQGELFLADWLDKNRVSEADIKTLIRWWELCRKLEEIDLHDPHAYWFLLGRLANGIPRVFPKGDNNLLADMLRNADLNRLRSCPSCGRGLYALDPRRKHCTPECRDRVRMNTESYRERKKEDMRKLRRIEKERRRRDVR